MSGALLARGNGWLHVLGEGALFGLFGGGLAAAWQAHLHEDLAHGTLWLAAERSLPLLLAGAMAGLFLSLGTGLLLSMRRRNRTSAPLSIPMVSGALSLLLTVPFLLVLRSEVMSLLPRTSGRLAYAAITAMVLTAAVLILLRVFDGVASRRFISLAALRSVMAAGGLTFLVFTGAAWAAFAPLQAVRASNHPSVILVSIDTLRADRLGSMGYPRATTPRLDELATEGIVFEQAISPAPWTLPAHVSLLTSQLPNEHRVRRVAGYIHPRHLLLSESFRDAGYRTAAFTGAGYVSGDYGYRQGFEIYEDHQEGIEGGPDGIVLAALEWVRQVGDEPFFLFVHTYEPHGPYLNRDFVHPSDRGRLTDEMIAGEVKSVSDPDEKERRYISDLYDGDIANTDRAIGGLLLALRDEGYLAQAIVAVTSDHGEDIWDHDAVDIPRHGHTLYEEIVHVPLQIRAPALIPAGIRLQTPVSLIDLAPTLLALAGLPPGSNMRGQNMASALRAGAEPEMRPLLSEAVRYGPPRYAWRENDLKVILTPDPAVVNSFSSVIPGRLEIFDLSTDRLERHSLVANPPAGTKEAFSILKSRAERNSEIESDVDGAQQAEELKQQLRSLGYVD